MSTAACARCHGDAPGAVALTDHSMQPPQRPRPSTRTDARRPGRRADPFSGVGSLLSTSSTSGARLRELMQRMGHSTERAALIYLHDTDERQRAIADAISEHLSKGMAV